MKPLLLRPLLWIAMFVALAVLVVASRQDRGVAATAPANGPIRRDPHVVPPTILGMNLSLPQYWFAQWTFADPIQSNGALLSRSTTSGGWMNLLPETKLDKDGRPIDVAAGTRFVIVIQKGAPYLPKGDYACRISPGWRVAAFGDATVQGSGTTFRLTIPSLTPRLGVVALHIEAARSHADLSELSCANAAGPKMLFNPAFLEDQRPFRVLRFKDEMRTDNAPPRDWATRPTPASFSQAGSGGMALEHMVALANLLGIDPWFSMPMDADPAYYRAFATYVRDHLAPRHRVYVEWSNEVWNGSYAQSKEATRLGQQRYPGVPPQVANDYYYADGVRAVMGIWSDVFRGQEKRLVRVLSSQAANPRRAEQALAHEETWRSVDAVATAPYFGIDGSDIPESGAARVTAIFARTPQIVDQAIGYARGVKEVANRYGLRYVTYEGGSSFVSFRPGLHDDLVAVNHDQRIYDVYALFLRRWKAEIGDLVVFLDSVSTAGPLGTFGHKEYTGQPLADAPKMRALADFSAANP